MLVGREKREKKPELMNFLFCQEINEMKIMFKQRRFFFLGNTFIVG